ncbi:MAG: hypothetical protein FJY97_09045 [candidate division Zixibacteria bacterium]|nr:hypothetical protein [candidate division Zixibacteria bacterium]
MDTGKLFILMVVVAFCVWSEPVLAQRQRPTQAERLQQQEETRQQERARPQTQQPARPGAAVEAVQGEGREVTLEAAITAEPARPLIQFTYSRPLVNFSEAVIGFRIRSFYPELRKTTDMEVSSPVIDIVSLFPGLIPEIK